MTEPEKKSPDLLESLPVGVVILNPAGEIRSCNTLALRLFGLDVIDLLNANLPGLTQDASLRQGIAEVLGGIEIHRTFVDTERSRVSCTIRKFGEDLLLTLEDVTNARRMDELQREFVQIILQRLRNPLTTLVTALSIANSDRIGEVPAGLREILFMCHQEVGRLNALTDDLRDLFLIETGLIKNDLECEICSLGRGIDRAVEELRNMPAPFNQVHSRIHIQGDPAIEIKADFEHFKKILLNLLKNAAVFSSETTPIVIDLREQSTSAKLGITDSGIGISQDAIAHVFERFYREDNVVTRKVPGNGLGLYNARKIAQLMGGVLYCESQQGKGTSFWAVFPKAEGTRS